MKIRKLRKKQQTDFTVVRGYEFRAGLLTAQHRTLIRDNPPGTGRGRYKLSWLNTCGSGVYKSKELGGLETATMYHNYDSSQSKAEELFEKAYVKENYQDWDKGLIWRPTPPPAVDPVVREQ